MSITSVGFFLFLLCLTLLYYLVPKRLQWMVLLAASLCFYCLAGLWAVCYLLLTAFSAWGAGRLIRRRITVQRAYFKEHKASLTKEEKAAYKKKTKLVQRVLLAGTLVLNFGLLCVFKYSDFAVGLGNRLFSLSLPAPGLLAPLGISFYTFQTMGYLVDVYWEKCDPEKNPLKLLLFTSFFPQMIQGPISSYSQLQPQLLAPHDFDFDSLRQGLPRILWGLFKKLVIADMIAPMMQTAFRDYNEYAGAAVLVVLFLYCIQIYADFSGYMDIVCGASRLLGITLRENFDRPYFSHSVAEYWRRWHISLGDWFKTYLYYPIAVSGWAQKLGKRVQKRFPNFGKTVPATLALILVWLTTGLWHGASLGYIAWGGLNGLFIILSLWMEPLFTRWTTRLRLTGDNRAWRVFQVLRTFVLMSFLKILPEVGTFRQGLGLWAQVFHGPWLPLSWEGWFPYGANWVQCLVLLFGTLLILGADLIKGRQPLWDFWKQRPLAVRFAGYFILICMILIFGCYGLGYDPQDFMYFKF